MLGKTIAVAAIATGIQQGSGLFSDAERQRIYDYWSVPDRYEVGLPADAPAKGPWQVRLTVEGSQWLWKYNKARGLSKSSPEVDPGAQTEDQKPWESWIDAKVAHDRWQASITAARANSALGVRTKDVGTEPPAPGIEPVGLVQVAGSPPVFAKATTPLRYSVTFDDGRSITYIDNVAMRPRYAYFRFAQGVACEGSAMKTLPSDDLTRLMNEAGIGESEGRVMKAVSLLEGGFDSINTYDTGYLSVGFIQFATASTGAGSLGPVLQREKRDAPKEFESDFHRYGVDVTDRGAIDVIDPSTGAEVSGPDAVLKVIVDKRLTAVFHRAGQVSKAFKVAQLKSAAEQYYPADDALSVPIDGSTLTGKISDVIKSEAGLATLMDRKVNTGHLDRLTSILAGLASEHEARSLGELAKYERDIVAQLRYRKNYLGDPSLSQPKDAGSRPSGPKASRHGSRKGG